MKTDKNNMADILRSHFHHQWYNEEEIENLIEHFTFPRNSASVMEHAFHTKAILKHESRRHSRLTVDAFDSYCFLYTVNGNCELLYDELSYMLIPESLAFIDCRKGFTLYRKEITSWSSYLILFDGSNSGYYFDLFYKDQIAAVPLSTGSTIPEKVSSLFSTCLSLWNDDFTEIIVSKLLMDLITSALVEKVNSPGLERTLPNHIVNAVTYINQNFNQPLSLDMIADQLNVSKYTLSHDFTKYIGVSVMENILQRRMKEAKVLLATTDLNVIEISRSIGFSSDTHFIQTFKKREGITPLQYRKQHNFLSYSHILN